MSQVILDAPIHRIPPKIVAGCVQLAGVDKLPVGRLVYSSVGDAEAGFTLFLEGGMIMVRVYSLPAAGEELQRLTDMYAQDRKTFVRVPKVGRWNPQMLKLLNVPSEWEHESFPTRPGCFVHIYRASRRALLIRYLGDGGSMLRYKPFDLFNEKLRIDDASWKIEFPSVKVRKDLKPAAREKILSKGTRREIDDALARARFLLKVPDKAPAKKVMTAIMNAIDELRSTKPRPGREMIENMAVDMGSLWGQTMCDELKWEWRVVDYGSGVPPISVVSPDRAFAIAPMPYILKLLTQRRAVADNTSLLLYNMIQAGNLPPSVPKQYLPLS